ncbi:MAG: polymer-forming cytoskeletal family protein [Acidobacteria bacterium]|nr:MAG: polymer-forming cytoskeletal family protein [Acidobacteriota bacterium]
MSFFGRDRESQQPSPPTPTPAPPAATRPNPKDRAPAGNQATHIAAGSKVVGQISGSAELVIDGTVDGEIDLESRVVIGASGHVKGEIRARAVQVGGKVQGNVCGHERVEVLASGRLEGDVVSPRVVIAEGAFFKGKVEMTEKGQAKPGAPQSAGRPATGSGGPPPAGAASGGARPGVAASGAAPAAKGKGA